jgi:heme exporter protein D
MGADTIGDKLMGVWHSWQDFWQMGGFAFYVWSAYAIVIFALFAIGIKSYSQHKRLIKKLHRSKSELANAS